MQRFQKKELMITVAQWVGRGVRLLSEGRDILDVKKEKPGVVVGHPALFLKQRREVERHL